jgi:hypothetical protein
MALLFACVETMMGSWSPEGFPQASSIVDTPLPGITEKNDEDDYGRQ